MLHTCTYHSTTFMYWAVDTTGLVITSVTCCGQEAQSVSDTSGGRSGTRSCWWMVDQICADTHVCQTSELTVTSISCLLYWVFVCFTCVQYGLHSPTLVRLWVPLPLLLSVCVCVYKDVYGYGGGGGSGPPSMMAQPMQHTAPQHHASSSSSSDHHHHHHQQQQQQQRRQKHALMIIDPNTGKNVLAGDVEQTTAEQTSLTTTTTTAATLITADSHRVCSSCSCSCSCGSNSSELLRLVQHWCGMWDSVSRLHCPLASFDLLAYWLPF